MINITQIDYRIQGYKKEKIQNNLGDITMVNFYQNYDEQAQQFSGLKVRETRTQERDAMGIPTKTTVDIEWFSSDEVTVRATKQLIKPLNSDDGLKVNEQSRGRLINKAKGYTIQTMGLENGKEFMKGIITEIELYKEGERQALIDAINNSTDPNATPEYKATVVAILDVSYIPS